MSLLDSDDFTFYGGKVAPGHAPRQQQQQGGSTNEVSLTSAEHKIRSRQVELDTQKTSTFSLRKKKDSEGRTHKKNKSQGKIVPPDSPKRAGPSPNTKSSKKQYAHLLENEDSSDDEEDDTSGAFVLSRGQQAREKRGSFKARDSTGIGYDTSMGTNSNSTGFTSFTSDSTPAKPLTNVGGQSNFPVFFTPPPDPLFSTSVPGEIDQEGMGLPPSAPVPGDSNLDILLGLDNPSSFPSTVSPNPIPTLPPPPPSVPQAPLTGYQPQQTEPDQTTPTDPLEWAVTDELYTKCSGQFKDICGEDQMMSGDKARDFFLKSSLPLNELSKIWKLSDTDGDGSLTVSEFTIAMKLVLMRRKNYDIPSTLPLHLKVPPTSHQQESSAPVFNFPPPPPPHANKSHVQATPTSVFNPNPTVTSLPLFSNTSSKTEPTTAISEVQPSSIEPTLIEDMPRPPLGSNTADISDILSASFISQGDVPLLLDSINVSIDSSVQEPAVNKLLSSLGGAEESTGDEDETSNLVSFGENPAPKPRKKKRVPQAKPITTELQRSRTVHGGRGSHAPPPRPPPYQKRSVSPPTVNQLIESSDRMTTPSPRPDSDILPIISPRPSLPPKPVIKTEKGHGRSTSWDLSKMLKEDDDLRFHDDVPSAEPPKIPPRRKKDEDNYYSDEDDGRRLDKIATPLQRSASTGSLASTGVPTMLPMKSRTSSVESGTLLVDGSTHSSISGRGQLIPEQSLQRTSTINRRPAPAPPPNKPKKPMYPPSFKKIIVDSPTKEAGSLSDPLLSEDSLQSAEVYQKKSKSELQKSIKRLKEENMMYSSLNNELSKKLNEMRQERFRLEARLNEELKSY